MRYESPTVELLGDYEMDRVQGEWIWAAGVVVVVGAAVYKFAAVVNIVVAANIAALANAAWNWNVVKR